MVALSAFIMSTFGMLAPVQGGIGAWHFMVIETLFIYGISKTQAQIFALVTHGSMTILLIILGFVALFALPVVNRGAGKVHLKTE